MSIWTHVVGIIRCEESSTSSLNLKNFAHILDNQTPRGSEGVIQYLIQIPTRGSSRVIITLYGDLRDYDNETGSVEAWFKKVIENIDLIGTVREAHVMICTDNKRVVTIEHSNY